MKNNYLSCKHGLTKLISLACFAYLLTLTGCTKLSCDFSYSPTEIRAGEVVSFSNQSTGADDYQWTFGDNGTSDATSPTHIYRKPGTYTVSLTIIRNKVEKRTKSQFITILDTFPTIGCSTDTTYAFTPTTFSVKLYNPWKKNVSYQWIMPNDAVVITGKDLDSSVIVCYFNQSEQTSTIQVSVQLGEQVPQLLSYSLEPWHLDAPSVLFTHSQQAMEQYCYLINKEPVFSAASSTESPTNLQFLANEQDSIYQYGDSLYTIPKVSQLFGTSIQGFQVDRLMGKIYAFGNGLWVCNMTGAHPKELTSTPVTAIKVDGAGNRIYWATSTGLYMHSLLGTEDNGESFIPTLVNTYSPISRISVNSNLH